MPTHSPESNHTLLDLSQFTDESAISKLWKKYGDIIRLNNKVNKDLSFFSAYGQRREHNRKAKNHLRYAGYHLTRVSMADNSYAKATKQLLDENPEQEETKELKKTIQKCKGIKQNNLKYTSSHLINAKRDTLNFGIKSLMSTYDLFCEQYTDVFINKILPSHQDKKQYYHEAKRILERQDSNLTESVYDNMLILTNFILDDSKTLSDEKTIENKNKKRKIIAGAFAGIAAMIGAIVGILNIIEYIAKVQI